MCRWTIVAAALSAALSAAAPLGAASPSGVELGGYLENRSAYRVGGDGELTEFRNTLRLELERAWGRWSVDAAVRARYETELEPETEEELDLRELVLEYRSRSLTLRLGRQQVIWGKTDGLRLLDVVNPLDLREFLLDDFVDLRIPLWMVDAEWFFGEQSLQVLVIPDLTFNDRADPGGVFFIPPGLPPVPVPVAVAAVDEPASEPSNWEYGVRWSGRAGPWELTANALYGWADDPVPFRRFAPGPRVLVEPRVPRRRTFGASGDVPLGPGILRAEATFTPDAHRDVATPGGIGRPERQDLLSYALGWDWLRSSWLISPQVFHEVVVDPPPGLLDESDRSFATLLLQRKLRQDRLTLRLFALRGIDNDETWISPVVSYQWHGRLELALGADLFEGAADGLFGTFDREDRLVLDLRYSF